MFGTSSRLNVAIFLSVILHAIVLFGVNFQFPSTKNEHAALPLEVVLINRNSISRPDKANAQANLNGKVNTDRSSGTKMPFPSAPQHKRMVDEESAWQETEQFEQEAQQQITAPDSEERTYPSDPFAVQPEQNQNIGDATDLVQRSLRSPGWKLRLPVAMTPTKSRPNANSSGRAPRTTALRVMLRIGASKWNASGILTTLRQPNERSFMEACS